MYKRVKLYELLRSLSIAVDMAAPQLANHHIQVAYLTCQLAKEAKFSLFEQRAAFLAALIHDIGILSVKERLEIVEREMPNVNNHGFKGAYIINNFNPLKKAAEIVKYHHFTWNGGNGRVFNGESIPLSSHLVHLADRICAMIKPDIYILDQVEHIYSEIVRKSDTVFEPSLIEAFKTLKDKEYIWLDIVSDDPIEKIADKKIFNKLSLSLDDLVELAFIFSKIIDFRSRFTALHSAGVGVVAQKLSLLYGFSKNKAKTMLIAGYVHDIGKLTIDNSILEKNGKLTEEEFNKIRSHTYYTYMFLKPIKNFAAIKEWAAYHHERLDGNGYPFHIKGEKLSLGSRIMAVADVFSALKEDRPYRKGMDDESTVSVLKDMAKNGALDVDVVNKLVKNISTFNALLLDTNKKLREYYLDFINEKE